MSGNTEFPHVHVEIFKDRKSIDPFNATLSSDVCGTIGQALWSQTSGVRYAYGGIVAAGIRGEMPSFDDVKADGRHMRRVSPTSPVLSIWGYFHGTQIGDTLVVELDGPSGEEVLRGNHNVQRNRATSFRSGGRKLRGARWPSGNYSGRVILMRDGTTIGTRRIETEIR